MNNVVNISDYQKDKVRKEIEDILYSLEEDYELEVLVNIEEINMILDSFYNYYERLDILYCFVSDMINHFNDLAIDAVDNNVLVNIDFILDELSLYELLESRIEINPIDTKKIINKLRKRLIVDERRKHN